MNHFRKKNIDHGAVTRRIINVSMGIFYILMGVFIVLGGIYEMSYYFLSPPFSYFFGGMMIFYGVFRLYRGLKAI